MRGHPLNAPIVGGAETPDGEGYWLVASDGGIFSFGDAGFHGSMGGKPLNAPIVGMAADPSTGGYWEVAADGGIFAFDAPFLGSMGGKPLNAPIVGMAATPDGGGYWMAGSDGGMFTFGDAPFWGSTGGNPGPAPVVTVFVDPIGRPYAPGAVGYDVSNWQCGQILPTATQIGVVQVSDGYLNSPQPNPCYVAEAAWAGPSMSSYIFMNPLPNPVPPEALTGPAGSCASSGPSTCAGYNFGYYWASHWVVYSRSVGVNPEFWWLDVELNGFPPFATDSSSQVINSAVIEGAYAGLRAQGVVGGIYSTALQWGEITGNLPYLGAAPLWVPGGGNISGGTYSAQSICAGSAGPDYEPFAGGFISMVQYGLVGNGYSGPTPPGGLDMDYSCP